jgi:serine protease Do
MKNRGLRLWAAPLVLTACITVAPPPASSQEETPAAPSQAAQQLIDGSRHNAITRAAERVSPAVVNIGAVLTRRPLTLADDFFSQFFWGIPPQRYSEFQPRLGSGFVFDRDGHVLTNEHVVHEASRVLVTLPDGRELQAELVGIHEPTDLAVLRVSAPDLAAAQLGNSDDLIVGEWAIAIGNPFGNLLDQPVPSVTVGVISAVGRSFRPEEGGAVYRDMIQTDAAINPGNSGGPLVNALGQVIGINTFIFSGSGGNIGIGFAIPINRTRRIVHELIRYGHVRPVYHGFEAIELDERQAAYNGLPGAGIYVTNVDRDSPAERAGLRRGDALIQLGGIRLRSKPDYDFVVADALPGDRLEVEYRRDHQALHGILELAER